MARPDTLILASASPRRRALLEAARFRVEVHPSGVDETWPGGEVGSAAVVVARRKLDAVFSGGGAGAGDVVIAADTEVVLDGQPLGKPADAADAIRMLHALAGREHRVVTGFCVRRGGADRDGAVSTRVCFRTLSEAEIRAYVDSGEPFGKAGAYAIQGTGGALIDRLEGSYTNVVGLPLAEVIAAVREVS